MTFRLGAALFLTIALAGCNGSATTAPTATVTALAISGTASLPSVGQTSQLTLTATMSSGAPQDVTSQAIWQSSNPGVATVSAAGLVTAQGYGGATISATYQGTTTQVPFAVTIAGTWVATNVDGSTVTWVLTQSQGIVAGTFSFAPSAPGYALSNAVVRGNLSGSALSWEMIGTISSDSAQPHCVGATPTINGVAQVQSGGTSMNATIQATLGLCDPSLAPRAPVGATITFTKQ